MHSQTVMAAAFVRRFQIVVAYDCSEYAEIVLEHALDQAARHDAPELHILTVVEDDKTDLDQVQDRLAALVTPSLGAFNQQNSWRARLHVRVGKPHEEIPNLAAEIRAQLIVAGRFGTHRKRRLGTVISRILDESTCPVLVVNLLDESPDAVPQCPACVTIRAETEGERWFCDLHRASERLRISSVIGLGSIPTRGGLMW